MRWPTALVAAVAIAACGANPSDDLSPRGLTLGVDAIHPEGSALEISFGRHIDGVLSASGRLLGSSFGPVQKCADGASIAAHPAGLVLAFRENHLSGWRIDRRGIATRSGIMVGDAMPDDLPTELRVVGTETGRIVSMSAGETWTLGDTCPV